MKLPLELINHIVDWVGEQKTLVCLLFVSHSWHLEAERRLYKVIEFLCPRQLTHFARTVKTNRRIAHHVRCFRIHIQFVRDLPDLFTLIKDVLRTLVELQALVVRTAGLPIADVLFRDNTMEFQLESLSWEDGWLDEDGLTALLVGQRRLKRLKLLWREGHPGLPPSSLPDLQVLTGNIDVLHAFLPGRHVTYLHWLPRFNDRAPDLQLLAQPLSEVRVLVFGGQCRRPSLPTVVEYLQKVEFLDLVDPEKDELDAAARLPNLRVLVLSIQWGKFGLKRQIGNQPRLAMQILLKIPSLRFIDIQNEQKGGSLMELHYLRYSRKRNRPQSIERFYHDWWRRDWETMSMT